MANYRYYITCLKVLQVILISSLSSGHHLVTRKLSQGAGIGDTGGHLAGGHVFFVNVHILVLDLYCFSKAKVRYGTTINCVRGFQKRKYKL